MKILHTLRSLSRCDGGPVSSTYQLAKGLRSCGIDTQILAIASRDRSLDLPDDEDVIRYVAHDVLSPFYYSRNFSRFLREHLRDFDAVHCNSMWQWPSHFAARMCIKADLPYFITPHGVFMPEALKKSRLKKRAAMAAFQRSDLRQASLIHVSSQIEFEALRLLGLQNPVAVIPNCVALPPESLIRQAENPRREFLFVGRLDPHKNIDMLLNAWNALGTTTAHCRLRIVGEGPGAYANRLRRIAERERLANVEFLGFEGGDRLTRLMAEADFLVLPSKSENFGMVAAEALAVGVPVVATQTSPWALLDREGCGISHEPQLAPLVEALRRAIATAEPDRRLMGLRGRRLVESRFVPERVATDMRAAYQWVLSPSPAVRPPFVFTN